MSELRASQVRGRTARMRVCRDCGFSIPETSPAARGSLSDRSLAAHKRNGMIGDVLQQHAGFMQASSASPSLERHPAPSWSGIGIALLAHTGWGAYPVLARYLQTMSDLPGMALLGLGNLIALLVYLPFIWRRIDGRILRSALIWGFALVVVLRSITNLLAARFTLAIYIQTITLMTPLFVALLSAGLFREPLPPGAWTAIGLSLVGALLMMSGEIGASGVSLALTSSDWIGIALAAASALCLAIYMILAPRTVRHAVPGESVLLISCLRLTGARRQPPSKSETSARYARHRRGYGSPALHIPD